MGFTPTPYIWRDGAWVGWADATVHVLAHGLHYGTSVFEGLRAYRTPRGPAVFRNREHARRFTESARMYGIGIPFGVQEIERACREVVSRNGLASAYIRPVAYRADGTFSLTPGDDAPVQVAVAAVEWGEYLGNGAIKNGIDVCVSSWRRLSASASPVMAKAGGHYLNAQLIAGEAKRNGYAEGIALDGQGNISEGSSENIFVVRDGEIVTPPLSSSVLGGITRDTVFTLARHAGIPVREQTIPRELLYAADEVFLTGTAAEITPVRSVDRLPVGAGEPGPVTRELQRLFFGLFDGSTEDSWGWLDYTEADSGAACAPADNGAASGVV